MKFSIPRSRRALVGGALAILAVGGVAATTAAASNAAAPSHPKVNIHAVTPKVPAAPEPVEATDTDNVQQGDQTGPDTAAADPAAEPSTPDTDNVQQGDQTGSDTGAEAPGSTG